jgi:D-xylose transport system permease protein
VDESSRSGIETPSEPEGPELAVEEAEDQAEPELEIVAAAAAPELVANSLDEYLRAWMTRIRSGDSGALPVVVALVLIVVFFQIERSQFLTSSNIVNLFTQAALYILFGAAEIYALILSEIDLSIGYVAAVAGFTIAELIAPPVNLVWWAAVLGGFAVAAAIGALQGTLITRLRIPSFIVTLAGLLGWQGVMLELANIDKSAVGGVINIDSGSPVYKLVNANMSPTLSWIVLVVLLAAYAALAITGSMRRSAQGLSAPPLSVTLLKLSATAVGGIVLVVICNSNRGLGLITLKGVPWVVPFVLVVLLAWSFLLGRTRLGRYIYAIGANPEAARRAGINVARIRTIAFMLCSLTAGMAGLVYASRLGSIATDIDGGTLVLYAVAAAVIGGASLFGGRGKAIHALLGGIVIAAVFNGLGLMGISTAGQDIATAVVLVLAVTVDSLVRRRSASSTT